MMKSFLTFGQLLLCCVFLASLIVGLWHGYHDIRASLLLLLFAGVCGMSSWAIFSAPDKQK